MPSLMVTDRRHITLAAPTDLRWVAAPHIDVEAAQIIHDAAERTVIRFAGDSATTILHIIFGTEQS